ncbi:PAS-domain containing protein [Silicimonas algicola]|uniref:histidine kinase n=1 Tax=Silicimonas algicola TaxID=1826607 RepID=A0A316G2B4_9RHOB|nr:PAS-domain containing protein [Silicimonas algicola]PWK55084.1 hypothetical protein C8D95_109172 [Silicimonas algicola]
MNGLVDPAEPIELRLERQEKIIDALIRRADRHNDIGPAAFRAFQSAIELQERIEAQTRDLKRAETELASVRFDRERTRQGLVEALSSMAEGFALFMDDRLHVTNEFLSQLLPDRAADFVPNLGTDRFFALIAESEAFVSSDRSLHEIGTRLRRKKEALALVIELRDDRWFQLNVQNTPRGSIVLLVTEITKLVRQNRVEKETLIDLQEDYLRAVFDNIGAGACTLSKSGRILLVNTRFCDLLNLPPEDVAPGVDAAHLVELLERNHSVDGGEAPRPSLWWSTLRAEGVLKLRLRQAEEKVLDIHANRLPDGGYIIEVSDVTLSVRTAEMLEKRVRERTAELLQANERLSREYREKARVEDELRVARDRAEAAISSKTRFLAAASHDLLQPINAAQLLISTLKESTRDTAYYPLVERLFGAFGSAEQLLRSLLDISRLESADANAVSVANVSLGALLAGIHGDQALLAEQKNVRFDVVSCNAVVRSDPVYLLRSIQNLVVNAIQYTEPGGRVLVGCRRRGEKVEVQVWDTGIGVALGDQKRIFEEFTRAGGVPLGSGMGLGLSVVDRACRLLGHQLSVRSKPGVGSIFSITLDRADGEAVPGEPLARLPAPEDVAFDQIVLVVENDEDVLFATTKWLEQMGASVFAARDRDESLRFIEDMGMPPDIILADYQLDNGQTGVQVIAAVREVTRTHVPAIIITADRSEAVLEAAIPDDVSVMTKPIKLSRLRQLMDWKVRLASTAAEAKASMHTKVGDDSAGPLTKDRTPERGAAE